MFVGFIAVVVILLVIVGLMATGATSGSGGVDQTKATKAISEISALAQSAGFFKTTTTNSNYAGMTVDTLQAAGIVAAADVATATTAADYNAVDTGLVDGQKVIASKAIPGVFYTIKTNAKNSNFFDIGVVSLKSSEPTPTLKAALDSTVTKLQFNPNLDIIGDVAVDTTNIVNTVTTDGTSAISFN